MKRNYPGCAICNSTWGDVWEEMEGERLFFCCALCALQFRNLLDGIHRATLAGLLDAIEVEGDRTGRRVTAERGGHRKSFLVTFSPTGDLLQFANA